MNAVGNCLSPHQPLRRVLLLSTVAILAGFNSACTDPLESQLNELTTTICHVPPGDPNSPQTLTVSAAAQADHLANHPLDSLGACDTNCKVGVCDDGIACTQDACLTNGCSHTPVDCPISECVLAADCNDNNDCTQDSCSSNLCTHNNISCNDNDACTTDSCSANGGCSHAAKDCSSLDNQCNVGSCSNGTCVATPKPTGSPCDDGNPNTVNDVCAQGACHGTPISACHFDSDCSSGNSCTRGTCPAGTCVYTAIAGCCLDAADCSDGTSCTTDACVSNRCTHVATNCNDNDACTIDSCSASSGCSNVPKDCSSLNDQCNTGSCSNGSCVATQKSNGTTCNDNNPNTSNDRCVQGVCTGTPAPECTTNANCNDNNACTADTCTSNKCIHDPIAGCCANASQCDDASACTTDACVANQCTHNAVSCDDGISCTVDSCNANFGCLHVPNCPIGSTCNASSGQCEGPPCPLTPPCSADQKLDTTTCMCICDTTKCTASDACHIAACNNGTQFCEQAVKSCEDNDPCTDDNCVNPVGCTHTPKCAPNTSCNPATGQCECPNNCSADQKLDTTTCTCVCDPLACLSGGDFCHTNGCNAETQHCELKSINCNDNNPCTIDSCNASCDRSQPNCNLGCDHKPYCDDGDPCTVDTCSLQLVDLPHQPPHRKALKCDHNLTNPGCCSEGTTCNASSTCQEIDPITNAGLCIPNFVLSAGLCTDKCSAFSNSSCAACDDHNQCTFDRCQSDGSCEHSLTTCPVPANQCGVVAYCSQNGGCGLSNAQCPTDAQCCKAIGSSTYKCIPCPEGGCIENAKDDPNCLP